MKEWFKSLFEKNIKEENNSKFLKCPNCKSVKWHEGPGGGSLGNIQCGNCNTKYNNLGIFGLEKIL